MPCELLVHEKAFLCCEISFVKCINLLDGSPDFSVRLTRATNFYCREHCVSCCLALRVKTFSYKTFYVLMYLSNHHHSRVVSMESVFETNNITIYKVSALKLVMIWDSVCNYVVHCCAKAFRKVMEIDCRGVAPSFQNMLVNQLIYFITSNPFLRRNLEEIFLPL